MATIWLTVFSLPTKATATLFACPTCAIHSRSAEIAISRPMMIRATSDRRDRGEQDDQGGDHDELVGHRVEERAERRHLVQAPREVAVQPVGDAGEDEHCSHGDVLLVLGYPGLGKVVKADEQRDQDDPRERDENGDVEDQGATCKCL